MTKRVLAMLLVCGMLLSMAACGNTQSSAGSVAESPASAQEETVSAEEAAPAEAESEPEVEASSAEEPAEASSAEVAAAGYEEYELTAEDEITCTGSLIPAWEGKGETSDFILGLRVAGGDVTGNLTGLYDGDLDLMDLASEDQIAGNYASVYAAYNG